MEMSAIKAAFFPGIVPLLAHFAAEVDCGLYSDDVLQLCKCERTQLLSREFQRIHK